MREEQFRSQTRSEGAVERRQFAHDACRIARDPPVGNPTAQPLTQVLDELGLALASQHLMTKYVSLNIGHISSDVLEASLPRRVA